MLLNNCLPSAVYVAGGVVHNTYLLCDGGQPILATYQVTDGEVVGAPAYFDLSGDPYVPIGEVGLCGSAASGPAPALAISGEVALAADNEIIPTPGAGFKLALLAWSWWNTTNVATAAVLRSASLGDIDGYYEVQAGFGKVFTMPAGYAIHLAENEPLLLALDGANAHGFSVVYLILPV